MHDAPPLQGLGRVDVRILNLTCEEDVSVVQTMEATLPLRRDLSIGAERKYLLRQFF